MKLKELKRIENFVAEVGALINLIALHENAVQRGSDKAPEFIGHLHTEAQALKYRWLEKQVIKKVDEKQATLSEDFYRPAKMDGSILAGRQINDSHFEVEEQLFEGSIQEARKRYTEARPSAKWWVWLCDHYKRKY